MQISPEGIAFIKRMEGVRYEAYKDVAGILTIGVGHTGPDVRPNLRIDDAEVDRLLLADLAVAEACIEAYCDAELTQAQYDALCSFIFNAGCNAFKNSTLLRLLNRGDYDGAAQQFSRWTKAGGQVVEGLTRRRQAEAELFTGHEYV